MNRPAKSTRFKNAGPPDQPTSPGATMPSMHRSDRNRNKGICSFFACILLVGSLTSCDSSGGNSEAQASLTLTPSTITLAPGAAGQPASLLLAAPAGAGAATISVTGLPTGVTVSPSTLSATPGATLSLTFTASSSAPVTTATVTFTTTINGQSVTTQASLAVQAATTPDFSLSAKPTTVSLVANGTPASVSLLATAQNGFSANIPVTIAGLPAGVTAQPSPITLTPGTAATLTLTAPQGTAVGSSTATLTGTSGNLTHTVSLAITVTAPPPTQPDFSLAVSPAALTLTPGGAGQPVQLTETALNGFTGTASVAVSGLPAGVTANPATLSLSPGTPQSITLTAGNSAQPGSASVVFTGTSGSLSHTATLALTLGASSGVNVTTYHNDNARDGWNAAETTLTPQNVNANTFGKLRELPVDGKVDAQPLYVSGVSIAGQAHNVLVVVTENASAYAFDADTGTQLWKVTALGANETTSDDHGCNQITPQIGITNTPVIDRANGPNGTVFFVAMSKDAEQWLSPAAARIRPHYRRGASG